MDNLRAKRQHYNEAVAQQEFDKLSRAEKAERMEAKQAASAKFKEATEALREFKDSLAEASRSDSEPSAK